jgi:hypothetical protein
MKSTLRMQFGRCEFDHGWISLSPEENMRRFLSGLVLVCAPVVSAQAQVAEYAVKIVCGVPDRPALAPGRYFTAINVHNPSAAATKFQFKVALTMPGVTPGPISKFFPAALNPDQALEIDCTDIGRRLETGNRFLKGFVVIQSPTEFDVVGVYTVAQSVDGRVVALELERVPVRRPQR